MFYVESCAEVFRKIFGGSIEKVQTEAEHLSIE